MQEDVLASPLEPPHSHVHLSELLAFNYDMVHALHSELAGHHTHTARVTPRAPVECRTAHCARRLGPLPPTPKRTWIKHTNMAQVCCHPNCIHVQLTKQGKRMHQDVPSTCEQGHM